MPFGGGGSQDVKQYVKSDPWKPAQPYLKDALSQSAQGFQGGMFDPGFYSGPRVAGWNPDQLDSRTGIRGIARGGTPDIDSTMSVLTDMMDAGPMNVPGRGTLVDMMSKGNVYRDLDQVKQSALGSAIPAATAMFSGSGMIGSTPAMDHVGRAATEAVAPIEYGAWDAAENRRLAAQGQLANQDMGAMDLWQSGVLGASSLMPGLQQAQYLPSQMLGQIGAQRQGQAQAGLDAQQQAYSEQQGREQQEFQSYLQTLMGLSGMGGTQSSQGQQPGVSPIAKVGAAGLGGLGAYGALAANPATAPFAIPGGLLAGLIGAF